MYAHPVSSHGRDPACSPCICAFFGTLELRDQLGIVLEFLDGGPLDRFLQLGEPQHRHRTIDFALRIRILREAASGIAFLHERGYVHRDVKPANVLLTADNHAKVTDFGISKHNDHLIDPKFEISNTPYVGTLRYMAVRTRDVI